MGGVFFFGKCFCFKHYDAFKILWDLGFFGGENLINSKFKILWNLHSLFIKAIQFEQVVV